MILDRVIQIRRQDGLSQEAVAKRMGMSQSVVARIELGLLSGRLPSLASLQNMRMRLVVNNSKFVLFKTKNLRSLSTTETLNWLRGPEFGIPFLRGFIFLPFIFGAHFGHRQKNECFKVKTILKF